jgi:hypothetical protein
MASHCARFGVPFVEVSNDHILRSMQRDRDGQGQINRILGTMPVWIDNGRRRPGRLKRQCTDYAKIIPSQVAMKGLMIYWGYGAWKDPRSVSRLMEITDWFDDRLLLDDNDQEWTLKSNPTLLVQKDVYIRVAFGFTIDELYRADPGRGLKWQQAWHPLIDLEMTRDDCKTWLAKHGIAVPPKSACVQCPYMSDDAFLSMYRTHLYLVDQARERRKHYVAAKHLPENMSDPDERDVHTDWNKACETDEMLRDPQFLANNSFYGSIRGTMYLHQSCLPLRELAASGELERRVEEVRRMTPLEKALKAEALETCGGDGAFSCWS